MSARRTHRKSRTGCRNCKGRKIKCDESKPECNQCRKHGISCDYLFPPGAPTPTSSDSSRSTSRASSLTPYTRSATYAASTTSRALSAPAILPLPSSPLEMADLLLMHHYTTTTSATLSLNRQGTDAVYRNFVPQLAFEHPLLMHAVLALGGMHLQVLRSAGGSTGAAGTGLTSDIREATERHLQVTLRDYRREVGNVIKEKLEDSRLQAMFLTGCIVGVLGFHALSSPSARSTIPLSKRHLHAPDDTEHDAFGIELLPTFRASVLLNQGVKTLVEHTFPALQSSLASPLLNAPLRPMKQIPPSHPFLKGIHSLFLLCQDHPPDQPGELPFEEVDVDNSAPDSLPLEYHDLYNAIRFLYRNSASALSGQITWALAWPIDLPASFISRVHSGIAGDVGSWRELLVVAWYCALLSVCEGEMWWLQSGASGEYEKVCEWLEGRCGGWVLELKRVMAEREIGGWEVVKEGEGVEGVLWKGKSIERH